MLWSQRLEQSQLEHVFAYCLLDRSRGRHRLLVAKLLVVVTNQASGLNRDGTTQASLRSDVEGDPFHATRS